MTMSPALPDIEALVEPGSRSLPKSMVMVPRTKLRELVQMLACSVSIFKTISNLTITLRLVRKPIMMPV